MHFNLAIPPNWEPSRRRSGNSFFTMENGHPTPVSAAFPMLSVLTSDISYGLQWIMYG